MSKDKEDNAAAFMIDIVERQGAVCSTVKDGHVLIFKRSFLQELLDKNSDKDKLVIFVKRPEFKN